MILFRNLPSPCLYVAGQVASENEGSVQMQALSDPRLNYCLEHEELTESPGTKRVQIAATHA